MLRNLGTVHSVRAVRVIGLVAAVGVPIYVRATLGQAWLDGLPKVVALCVSNSVVIAVVLGVGLNLLLNVALGGARGR